MSLDRDVVARALSGDNVAVETLSGICSSFDAKALAADVTTCDTEGRGSQSVLHRAALNGRSELLQVLLKARVAPDATDDAFNTPLHLAARHGHARVAHVLLRFGANSSAANSFGRTPGCYASATCWDDAEVETGKAHIRAMLAGKFEPYGSLPVESSSNLLGYRCDDDASWNVPDEGPIVCPPRSTSWRVARFLPGGPPLTLAELVVLDDSQTVEAKLTEIVAHGGEKAARDAVMDCEEASTDKRVVLSALHTAARMGHRGIMEILLSTRADPNVKNDQLSTPLHFAAESGRCEIVQLLLDCDADVNAKNSFGRTPEELSFVKGWDNQEVAARKAVVQKLFRKMKRRRLPLVLKE